jgi:uncharacterized phage-associated protein
MFDVDTIAKYLHYKRPEISSIRLQKSLYFLFCYYGAFYTHETIIGECEGMQSYPEFLFDAEFEAWKFGPVIRDVHQKSQQGFYNNLLENERANKIISETNLEIYTFIEDLTNQLNEISDFMLVERVHMDEVWRHAYFSGEKIMPKEFIIKEYKQKFPRVDTYSS